MRIILTLRFKSSRNRAGPLPPLHPRPGGQSHACAFCGRLCPAPSCPGEFSSSSASSPPSAPSATAAATARREAKAHEWGDRPIQSGVSERASDCAPLHRQKNPERLTFCRFLFLVGPVTGWTSSSSSSCARVTASEARGSARVESSPIAAAALP